MTDHADISERVPGVSGKIPTLFQRTDDRRYVIDEVTPGCEWVLMGQGVATRKFDGTCVRITHVWNDAPQVAVSVRREVKAGKQPPEHWTPMTGVDPNTGKQVGWEPYSASGFAKLIEEVVGDNPDVDDWPEGTYELCGPKVNGNPEGFDRHVLVPHGAEHLMVPLTFSGLRDWLSRHSVEGIVWHHPDGRMAKLKRRDFPAATSTNGDQR